MPSIVVTRPQPEAAAWAQRLQTAGLSATCLPMMEIGPSTHAEAQTHIQTALRKLHSYSAIMFVSVNAVRYFFSLLQAQGLDLRPASRLWAPGPGTAQALLAHGVSSTQIDQPPAVAAQFDSESLWEQVQHQVHAAAHILIVRGCSSEPEGQATGRGRQWLSEQLAQRGSRVDFAPVYERSAPASTEALQKTIVSLQEQSALWLFSSSECLQNLVNIANDSVWSQQTALATHPRIAEQARMQGFGCVIETKPTIQDIACSIKSLHDL